MEEKERERRKRELRRGRRTWKRGEKERNKKGKEKEKFRVLCAYPPRLPTRSVWVLY